ncbi:hypothetical protein NP233_g13034 [Leucocoprinus birnbaumii]|uniref:Uncharacterized protein n=1 Tax=Leucocoprinus birnbaumii TaxID=56174 RepID=A0AAD5YIZ1_9AGAR|nr:hypothetical protein NP233_g13034 [Leucocoprinus birnbaumii]
MSEMNSGELFPGLCGDQQIQAQILISAQSEGPPVREQQQSEAMIQSARITEGKCNLVLPVQGAAKSHQSFAVGKGDENMIIGPDGPQDKSIFDDSFRVDKGSHNTIMSRNDPAASQAIAEMLRRRSQYSISTSDPWDEEPAAFLQQRPMIYQPGEAEAAHTCEQYFGYLHTNIEREWGRPAPQTAELAWDS